MISTIGSPTDGFPDATLLLTHVSRKYAGPPVRALHVFVKFQRQVVGIGEEGEPPTGVLIDPNGFC
ncbi:hypothetical protein GCM10028818_04150 [Spirosoma horti]